MTFLQLQKEVTTWGRHNFPKAELTDPLLGASEEVGELCHAHLKMKQGIRGTQAEHQAAKADAVCDCIIYLAHYAGLGGLALPDEHFRDIRQNTVYDDCQLLLYASALLGKLSESQLNGMSWVFYIESIASVLSAYCHLNAINFEGEIILTWARVSKRDWIKYPKDGLTK